VALIDIGVSEDDIKAANAPVPAGEYDAMFKEFYADKEHGASIIWPTKKGGRMTKVVFELTSPDPAINRRTLFYNAVIGQFSFANLVKAYPMVMNGKSIDSEAPKGIPCKLVITEGINPKNGEANNNIDKIISL
jgi:hypothetical protein